MALMRDPKPTTDSVRRTARLKLMLISGFAGLALSATPLDWQDFTSFAEGPQGITPVEYKAMSDSAAALVAREDWRAAAPFYERLVGAYPHDPALWNSLGFTRRQAGEHLGAARAYGRAVALGTPVVGRSASGHAAREYARAGEPDSALVWLSRAILEHKIEGPLYWLGDTAFVALRSAERYRRLAPPSAEGLDREAGWRLDIDYLLSQIRRYNEARDPVPDSIARRAEALKQRVGSLTDLQVVLEMQRLVALMGRNHNGFIFGGPRWSLGVAPFPLRSYLFGSDVYVYQADSAHVDLVGAKILTVDGVPSGEVLQALAGLIPVEGEELRFHTAELLLAPDLLHALGIARRPDRLDLRIVDRIGQTRTVEVLGGRDVQVPDNMPPSQITTDPPPLYTREGWDPYWFEHLPEDSAVYVRFLTVGNRPRSDETLPVFALRLRRFLEERPEVKNLIVDVRRNGGGNSYLYPELLRTVIAFDARQGHRTYAIIDRRTYSAAMNFVIDLDRLTNVVFVGEATGGPVEQHGDASLLKLPFSGRTFAISSIIWNLSAPRDDRRWIAPDVPVALTAADYFANRDPVLDVIRALVRRR